MDSFAVSRAHEWIQRRRYLFEGLANLAYDGSQFSVHMNVSSTAVIFFSSGYHGYLRGP